ncbi:GTPase Era [Microbulbifer agarilyticus]|uniref:GTPase Era n=1 Tax=Microbulbifer agarilyticus TaxID=260552 RepID=UPI001CD80959|nr:GTPase Era [Microbulbifer agarilyticus]MCA0892282.1 GTPase Era [Microbulbifer agarilyticus]
MSEPNTQTSRCGYVAIVGRPNVGKSTLLNHLLGQKICITSRKPQTTRHNMLGIKTEGPNQIIFVDTPGLHAGEEKAINRYMNRAAISSTRDVDVVVFVVEPAKWTEGDELVAQKLRGLKCPLIVAVNKVDQLQDKNAVLPQLQALAERFPEAEIVPISALRTSNLQSLEDVIVERLPEGMHFFEEDQITDRSSRFLAAEIVREKVMRQLGAEIPYAVTVEVEEFSQEGKVLHISAAILVERNGQKRILIGTKGERIKQIGQQARVDMERLFDSKVMLNLWVKVKSGWSDDERALRSLGYVDKQ